MLPPSLQPQLLTSARAAPVGDRWIHEVKYDGVRLLCRVEGGRARLLPRGGQDWTARAGSVTAAVEALGIDGAWLDGELVALRPDGLPDFDGLHAAMRGGRGAPLLAFQVWDAPWLDGRDLSALCVLERKARLEERVRGRSAGGVVRYCDHLRGRGPVFFAHAFRAGVEGIVSKRVGSPYRPGVRSRDWLKVKCFRTFRVRVAGCTPSLETVFAGEVGEGGRLAFAGRVLGWGPIEARRELRAALAGLRRDRCPLHPPLRLREEVCWVEPVLEVEVTALCRAPGEKLRHAVLKRVVGIAEVVG
jgi:bifunctional non-homologous end joining protein LigD